MKTQTVVGVSCLVAAYAIQWTNGDCGSLTTKSQCKKSEDGCTWGFATTGDNAAEGFCSACSEYNGVRDLCTGDCLYNPETAECAPKKPQKPSPLLLDSASAAAATSAAEGWAYVELDTYAFTDDVKADFEAGLAASLGAEQVFVDDMFSEVEKESCGLAPLCGSDAQMLTLVDDYENVPIPEFVSCCPINDTRKTEACQSVDISAAHSRVAGLQTPFCPQFGAFLASDRCMALQDPQLLDQTKLVLELGFEKAEIDASCCLTCACYGDPHCKSFDGTYKSWRLCDGRDPANKCDHTASRCTKVAKDHEGNACKWKQGGWGGWWKDGSPCQPDVNAAESWLLMYEADSFAFWIRQEERGVIREAKMVTESGNYTMTANTCLKGSDFSDTWMYSGQGINNQMVSGWKRITEPKLFDVVWLAYDSATGIQLKIRCTATKRKTRNQYGNYRLNIDALVEPVDDFQDKRQNVNGFCATNSLLLPSHTEKERESLAFHEQVESECDGVQVIWTQTQLVEIAVHLCGSGVTPNSLQDCYEDFCAENAFPYLEETTCVRMMQKGDLDKAFCAVQSDDPEAQQVCLNEIEDFGWEHAAENFREKKDVLISSCINSLSVLPQTLAECQSGVTLQYQEVLGDESSWVDYAAFPESTKLCDNQLVLEAASHMILFTRPIRFIQYSKPISCSQMDACKAETGLKAILKFHWPHTDRPTTSPTPNPTPTPSLSPTTRNPTKSPTPPPSPTRPPNTVHPTPGPTKSPSRPTPPHSRHPSPSPTTSPTPTSLPPKPPTDKPTPSPTSPTKSPTLWPTGWSAAPSPSPTIWTPIPSESPTPNPTYCTPECPPETEAPAPQENKVPASGSCPRSFYFTHGDLQMNTYCGCNFESFSSYTWANDNTPAVDLKEGCPAMFANQDISSLEKTCELLCTDMDNDSGRCGAWAVDHSTGLCYMYSCNTDHVSFEYQENFSSGLPCRPPTPVGRPTIAPTVWLPGRRLSKAGATQQLSKVEDTSKAIVPRRSLVESYPLYKVKFLAMYSSESGAENMVNSADSESQAQTATSVLKQTGVFQSIPFVRVNGLQMGKSWRIEDLRFARTPFDPFEHNKEGFLSEVCEAVERTIGRRTRLSNVRCGRKLFMLRAYGDANGLLVVVFRIHNVRLGEIQSMLQTPKGAAELARQLERSRNNNVKVLGASLDAPEEEAESGAGNIGAIAAIAGVSCLSVIAVAAAVKKYKNRQQSGVSQDEQIWNMVNNYR